MEMQKHCIDIVTAVTNVVNPDQQVTVDVKDQPLYALSKLLQFVDPKYGLDKYFVMMGPLHVEQVLLHIYGELIASTGMDKLLDLSGLEFDAPGSAVVGASFITRARYIVQVPIDKNHLRFNCICVTTNVANGNIDIRYI